MVVEFVTELMAPEQLTELMAEQVALTEVEQVKWGNLWEYYPLSQNIQPLSTKSQSQNLCTVSPDP